MADPETIQILTDAFVSSKMTREIIMGVCQRIQMENQSHTFGKMFEVTCNILMNDLLTHVQTSFPKITICSFSMDEIVIRLTDDFTTQDIATCVQTADPTSMIGSWFKFYLKIEEYELVSFDLPNKKTFYVKNVVGSVPVIKLLEPDNKVVGLKIVGDWMEKKD